jgi:hypothetical protein
VIEQHGGVGADGWVLGGDIAGQIACGRIGAGYGFWRINSPRTEYSARAISTCWSGATFSRLLLWSDSHL